MVATAGLSTYALKGSNATSTAEDGSETKIHSTTLSYTTTNHKTGYDTIFDYASREDNVPTHLSGETSIGVPEKIKVSGIVVTKVSSIKSTDKAKSEIFKTKF